ncbi:hypothetical protein EV1_002084 [Malus domestica]
MNFCCLLRISQKERRTFEIKVQQGPYLPIWNRIFVISCVFAVFLGPLFFYVVIINQDNQVPSNGQNVDYCCLSYAITHGCHFPGAFDM